MTEISVWGHTVQVDEAGKRVWPLDLKREAVRRIKEEHASPKAIARQLGTTEALVRKWHVADQKKNGGAPIKVAAAFAEIVTTADGPFTEAPSVPVDVATCRLVVGKLSFEFPPDISETNLKKLVRVAEQSA